MINNLEGSHNKRKKIGNAIVIITIVLIMTVVIILGFQYKSKINQMNENAIKIAFQMDNFFQIGELYISNYAHPDLINLPVRQQYEQFERDLLPFPFFSQLSSFSSNGQLITGFPNDNASPISDELIVFLINRTQSSPTFYITINKSSQSINRKFAFIKILANPDNTPPIFLIGEIDWSSNPLNLALIDSIQKMNQLKFSINILNDSDSSIMSLDSSALEYTSINQGLLKSTHPLGLNDWKIEISVPYSVFLLDAFKNMLPLLLILLIIGMSISYAYISGRIEIKPFSHSNDIDNRDKKNLLIPQREKDVFLKEELRSTNGIQDFTTDIIRLTKINEIGKVLIKHVSTIQSGSIRILFFNNPYLPSQGFFSLESGDQTKKYAYLDTQIIKRTKEGNKLFIPDIRKAQLILLSSEKLYPLSIYVYPIIDDDLLLGLLWLGFEQTHQITPEEDKSLREIIEKASPYLSQAINNDVLNTIASEQDSILECLQQPIIILDKENIIIYLNKFIIELESEFQDKLGFSIEEINLKQSIKLLLSDETIKNMPRGGSFQKDTRVYQVLGFQKEITKNRLIKIFIFRENTAEISRKDNFSNNISLITHSMRTPLTSMKGYTNMLAMIGQVNDQQKEYIRKIISSVDEMSNLIKNLLDIEKLEQGVNFQFQNIDCITIINKVIQSLKPYSIQKQIEIKLDIKGSQEVIILADSFLLERAFFNLLENAIRYTNRKGLVSVEIIKNDINVEIKIKDNGIGIAQIDIPHIFEKYYRVKISPSSDNVGSGLGLYLVKTIINQHNGKISISSVLGKGSEFIVELPHI